MKADEHPGEGEHAGGGVEFSDGRNDMVAFARRNNNKITKCSSKYCSPSA